MELSEWRLWWKRVGRHELSVLLMGAWDPIGVSDDPDFAGEYDRYIGPLATRLRSGATLDEIATHLDGVAREWIGGDEDRERHQEAARQILDWYAASTASFERRDEPS